jgi:hypothetical protein
MNDQVTAEEIRQLLLAYAVALDAADSLPPVVRIAARPGRWTLFEPLRRLPRLTVGTSTMLTYHVQRSTAALARRYARIAATRGLTEEDERASRLVRTFRESLPEVRWKLIVPGLLVAALLAVQVVLGVVARSVYSLTNGLARPLSGPQREQLAAALKRTLSSVLGAEALGDLLNEVVHAGLPGLLTLAGTVVVAGYLVFRPLSPAFRVKRALFNLAPTGRVDLARTTTTWHVARSVGLYGLERDLFARLGARAPDEIGLDIGISVAAAAAVAWFAFSWIAQLMGPHPGSDAWTFAAGTALLGIAAVLTVTRAGWLAQTARARRRTTCTDNRPGGYAVPHAERVVETRSVFETAAFGPLLPLLYHLLFFLPLPSPPWVRLVRERRTLDRASPGLWPAVGSAVLLWLIPPLPVAIQLTRLARLQPSGVGSARRTRWWLVPLLAAGMIAHWLDFVVADRYPAWLGLAIVGQYATLAVAFAAVQREHNALIRSVGTPLPGDDPLWTADPQVQRTGDAVVAA